MKIVERNEAASQAFDAMVSHPEAARSLLDTLQAGREKKIPVLQRHEEAIDSSLGALERSIVERSQKKANSGEEAYEVNPELVRKDGFPTAEAIKGVHIAEATEKGGWSEV